MAMLRNGIYGQNHRSHDDMKQPAEGQIGHKSAGQDGMDIPDVSINVGQSRSMWKYKADPITCEGVLRTLWPPWHGDADAL